MDKNRWQHDHFISMLRFSRQCMFKICKYELIKGNQIIHTEIENLKIRIYEEKELTTILQEIGFSQIRIIKAFDYSKPNKTDETIVYECRK